MISIHLITKLSFDNETVTRGLCVNEIININFWVIGNLVVILDMELIQHEWTYDDVASLLVTTVGQNTRNILQHNIWLVVKSFVCVTHEFQSHFRILNKKAMKFNYKSSLYVNNKIDFGFLYKLYLKGKNNENKLSLGTKNH